MSMTMELMMSIIMSTERDSDAIGGSPRRNILWLRRGNPIILKNRHCPLSVPVVRTDGGSGTYGFSLCY